MGRGLAFLQRRQTSGQRGDQTMLNTTCHQGNAIKTKRHTSRTVLIKVTGNNKCWQGRGETGGSFMAGGDGKRCGRFGKPSGSSSVKPRIPMCPSNSAASCLPKRDENAQLHRTCMQMPTAALLTASRGWNRPEVCQWTGRYTVAGPPHRGDRCCCSGSKSRPTLQPHGLQQTRLLCPPLSQDLLKSVSIESVMPSNHLILCHPLLLLPSVFPSIRVFSSNSALLIWWPRY